MVDYSANVAPATALMDELLAHVRAFDPRRLHFVPAVMEMPPYTLWRDERVAGLRKYTDSIERRAAHLHDLATSAGGVPEDPLPTVQSLASSWKQITTAPGPVPALQITFKSEKSRKTTFVDVVARGGAEWIRVYSKKTSHLLSEFREQDSYLTSDEESGDEDWPPQRRSGVVENSLTRLVDELLIMAEETERIPCVAAPTVTIRLSRIEEFPEGGHPDPRIPATFDYIRKRGVKLLFGDLSEVPLSSIPTAVDLEPDFRPTHKLNLDPTALIGLCSDLLHYPLPEDAAGARKRFYRPQEIVDEADHRADGARCMWDDAGEEDAVQSQNSRQLVRALLEEMEVPLVEVIRDTMAAIIEKEGGRVELWATRPAVRFLQDTIRSGETVGEGHEQRRMRRLTGLEDGDFWEGSRYAGKAGVLQDIKLHIFDEDPLLGDLEASVSNLSINGKRGGPVPACKFGMTSFHVLTACTAQALVDEYHAHVAGRDAPGIAPLLKQWRLTAPPSADDPMPFNVVALESLARASREGMTTLTMGHVAFRDLHGGARKRPRNWSLSNYDIDGEVRHAVAWVLPYRSLGESKRVKFAAGDYSFPKDIHVHGEPR